MNRLSQVPHRHGQFKVTSLKVLSCGVDVDFVVPIITYSQPFIHLLSFISFNHIFIFLTVHDGLRITVLSKSAFLDPVDLEYNIINCNLSTE